MGGLTPQSFASISADGVMDHRLVINGRELLANALGYGIKAGAGASGEDYSFQNFRIIVFL